MNCRVKRFATLLSKIIPDYVVGKILYRYLLWKMRVDALMEGILLERVVEYNWILENLKVFKCKGRLLDVGCSDSFLCYELLQLEFEVHGIDVRPFVFKNPSFKFYKADICQAPFPSNYFNVIIAVSTIEHIGLGAYGDPIYPDGDVKAVNEIARILSPNGYFLLTVPFGHQYNITWMRIYDWDHLLSLLVREFELLKAEFFCNLGGKWIMKDGKYVMTTREKKWVKVSKNVAEYMSKLGSRSIACLVLKKKSS